MAYSGLTRPQFVLTAHLIMYVNYMHISNQINSWGNSGPSTKWNIARSYLNAFLLKSYIKWSTSQRKYILGNWTKTKMFTISWY